MDNNLTIHYEQIRETILKPNVMKNNNIKGLNILMSKGLTAWIDVLSDFQTINKHDNPIDFQKRTASQFKAPFELTNILTEITLKNIMKGQC